MKKSLFISLIIVFVVILAGCGNGGSKKLTAGEQTALDYVNIYLNGTDAEAKKKFIEDQVHPEVQPIFELASSSITTDENKFPNPKVIESKEIENEGEKATIILVKGDGDKEFIALIMEEKFGWGFISTTTSEEMKTAFTEMRSNFKTK